MMATKVQPTLPVDELPDDAFETGDTEGLLDALYMFAEWAPVAVEGLPGCYITGDFNPDTYFWRSLVEDGKAHYRQWMGCYGVCDSPEQFIEKYGTRLEADPRAFVVCFTPVRKQDQPKRDGWRWHKWGPYIGKKRPRHEYLADEGPSIEVVYCYHVLQVREEG